MTIHVDPECQYTETHEWVRVERDYAYTGITDYAQQQLSDIVYVELPEIGDRYKKGDVYAVVESVKAASDCYMAVAGEVVEINENLAETPETVNTSPYVEGWFVKVLILDSTELAGLMDAAAYQKFADRALEEGGGH